MSNLEDLFNKNVNLDELFAKTKTVAEAVTKKSSERLDLSRKKVDLLNLKNKLSRAYEDYGKIQFSLYLGEEEVPENTQKVIVDITELKNKVENLEHEIEEAKQNLQNE